MAYMKFQALSLCYDFLLLSIFNQFQDVVLVCFVSRHVSQAPEYYGNH